MAAPAPVRFGVNYLPGPAEDTLRWARAAEDAGFDIVGIADSQSVYRDVYMCLALCAAGTRRVRLGPRVINPLTRHPAVAAGAAATLAEMAPGRTMLGIGTGDSAVLNLGLTPSTRAHLRAYVAAVRELLETGHSVWDGRPCRMTWGGGERIPIYLAASGPRMLRLAGEIGDGVVINTGLTPDIVRDSIAEVRAGAESAGRRLEDVDCWWLPVANVRGDRAAAIDEVAMTLASAGSHLSRFTTEGKHIPRELHDAVVALGRPVPSRRALEAGQLEPRPGPGARAPRLPRGTVRGRGHGGRVRREDRGGRGGGRPAVLDEHPLRRQGALPPTTGGP